MLGLGFHCSTLEFRQNALGYLLATTSIVIAQAPDLKQ
jgi:hypothetical protein